MANISAQRRPLSDGEGQQQAGFVQGLLGVTSPLFLIGLCLSTPAQAQLNSDVLRPSIGLTASVDSNVLGLSSPEAALAATGTRSLSDSAWTAFAGVDYRQLFGRQLITANVANSRTKFNRLSRLDYRGENANADWAWQLGNNWNGNAGYFRTVTLAPFTDFHVLDSNTNTMSRRYLSAAWRIHPDWQLHGEATRYAVDYSLPVQRQYDRSENQGGVGLDYTTRSGNSVGVQWRLLIGHLPHQLLGVDRLANDYRQQQIELKSDWQVSGKSHLKFAGSLVERRHEVYPERNFRGYNGRMTLTVAATGSTLITVATWRETGIFDELSTVYSTNRGSQLGARWNATSKITVEGTLRRESRDFTRSVQFSTAPDYRDVLRTSQLSVKYVPLARLNFELLVFDSGKGNSSGLGEYARHGASLSSRYQF